jgi:archaeosine synthase beta-subunit
MPGAMGADPTYPAGRRERDRFVLDRRRARPEHDPWRHQGVLVEDEPAAGGGRVRVATVFLTGRECPWRCVMCDLWRFTLETDTPPGAISHQIRQAMEALRAGDDAPPPHLKLYNAGSFFDARAVPPDEDAGIAVLVAPCRRVIVESHPALVGDRTWRFHDALRAHAAGESTLEVAMGLETTHPGALEQLHKGLTVDGFHAAAAALAGHGVALRVFLLVHPPFVAREEQDDWLRQSVEAAFASGASTVSLIPMRSGNGAVEALAEAGQFTAPTLADVERSAALSLRVAQAPELAGRHLLVDVWDLERLSSCASCFGPRRERLRQMNLAQQAQAAVACPQCGGSAV